MKLPFPTVTADMLPGLITMLIAASVVAYITFLYKLWDQYKYELARREEAVDALLDRLPKVQEAE